MRRGGEVDRVIERIGRANNRVVPWLALQDAGVGHRMIEHRVAIGRLYRRHTGVYLLDPPEHASRLTLMTAAVAACGPDAMLSHLAAAELWGLLPARPGDIDVTVIGHNPGVEPGIRRHRSRTLEPGDIRSKRGVRVTSPARTIVDNARHRDIEQILANAFVAALVTESQIDRAIARWRGSPGVPRLNAILHQDGGARRTRSWAERRLLSLVRQAGLPVPLTNRMLHGHQVDALWPNHRLVVEIDGYGAHGGRRAFENDRARDATHVANGYRVMRFTATQLDEQPLLVIAQLAAALALASETNAVTSAA